MIGFQETYQNIEFNEWAYSQGLLPSEEYLIDNYLNKQGNTLEAGTAGGRILLEMKKKGFNSLYGFDNVPKFIEVAKQKDTSHSIDFRTQDAIHLNYEDSYFDNIIYLQQVLCHIIDSDLQRFNAFLEAYRILKKGGTAIFSFLSFDTRIRNPLHSAYISYIYLLRKLCRSNYRINYLPSLQINRKNNYFALLDCGPYMYWYKMDEIYQLLKEVNFEVIAIASDYQLKQRIMHKNLAELASEPLEGMLYFVCKK